MNYLKLIVVHDMMNMYGRREYMIDLHMHSFYSDDGEYTPTQLVDMCH